ncbi:MAG: CAP domain-containing protein [Phycisphaerales bacterium]|jgi:hypothetical protein|nr:CAP domain-containing protein [Phycisphaerales bacterium]
MRFASRLRARERRPRRFLRPDALFDALEPRLVLANFDWSPEEVLLLELVNRARSDPQAEAQRLGLDLTAGLTIAELARLIPSEPLAMNAELTLAARLHSLDMAERDFFDHTNPDGLSPTDRARAQGYTFSAGENIAAGYDSIEDVHRAWLESIGHRKNVFSLHDNFNDTFHYDEFGAGFAFTNIGPYFDFHTELFGYQGSSPKLYILGVVIDDFDHDSFYDVGEAYAQVRIDVALASDPASILGTYTTDGAGNYQIVAPGAGTYLVTFTDLRTGLGTQREVAVSDVNVKVDAFRAELTQGATIDPQAQPGAPVALSSSASGLASILSVNIDGQTLALYQRAGGEWTATDPVLAAGFSGTPAQVATWSDPRDGLSYAAIATDASLLILTRSGDLWTGFDLLAGLEGSTNFDSNIVVFTSRSGAINLAGLDASGDLVLFAQDPAGDPQSASGWSFTNISDDVLTPRGRAMPVFAGPLTAYVTPWGAENIVGLDGAGQVQAVWQASGTNGWTTSNLSAITGAPAMTGALSVFQTSWNAINIAGVDASGRLQVTWWLPRFGGAWAVSDLTASTGGTPFVAGSTSAYVTSWGGLNVAGIDQDGNVTAYWWAPGMARWVASNLSAVTPGSVTPATTLLGASSTSGRVHLAGLASDGDVVIFWWQPGASWSFTNLTDELTTV